MKNFFKKNNEAVSPVIGVILMVAITVVLAAVVFLLVSRISSTSQINAPTSIGINHNGDNTFSVSSINSVIAYDNLTIKDNGIVQSYEVNGDLPTGTIAPGDVIALSGLTAGQHNVSFVYRNEVIYQASFIA